MQYPQFEICWWDEMSADTCYWWCQGRPGQPYLRQASWGSRHCPPYKDRQGVWVRDKVEDVTWLLCLAKYHRMLHNEEVKASLTFGTFFLLPWLTQLFCACSINLFNPAIWNIWLHQSEPFLGWWLSATNHSQYSALGRFNIGSHLEYDSKGRVPKLKSAKVWCLTIEGGEGVTQNQILI